MKLIQRRAAGKRWQRPPAIIWGAAALAALSLAWSGYAITQLMHSGPFGLSVAVAGDIGWITVLYAEYRGITIAGKHWTAPAAGWLIAVAVAGLLVLHGLDAGSIPQAIAGPFVVLVGKTVWTFGLAAMADPTALTPEQEAEINSVIRHSEYVARMLGAESDAEIVRIQAQARTVLARDEADFQITLERIGMRAELARRAPLALSVEPTGSATVELPARPVEPTSSTDPVSLTSAHVTTPEPEARPAAPERITFGFTAHQSAQSAQRAQGVAQVAELLAADPGLTSGQVAETLKVSPATAKRYLREARQGGTKR